MPRFTSWEPLPRGRLSCRRLPQDMLDGNWQRLVLTHLAEKPHLGVLTGSPITDVRITLVAGRAHLKHTEGGDFRQATYRAVRQGLMEAESILLEPWYDFRLVAPGRVSPGRPPAHGRAGRHAGDRRGAGAHRLRPGGRPAGLWPGGAAYTGAGDG